MTKIDLDNNLMDLAEFLHKSLRYQWVYHCRISTIPPGQGTYGEVITTVYRLEKG